MVRSYSDMLWSSYNFWCKREYDGFACDNTRWIKADMLRSPDLFHDMILRDLNNTLKNNDSPLHKGPSDMSRPCVNAGGYYTEYLDLLFYKSVPPNDTLVLASEELESNPMAIWAKVSHRMKQLSGMSLEEGGAAGIWSTYSFNLGTFSERRYNPQNAKGGGRSIAVKDYVPGIFRISKYMPLRNDTKKLLDKCWTSDCKTISKITGYKYSCMQ